ncbi:hypothetical protein [Chitinophaga qingshengii]|nr:hypothetical protein [Chitinophaga qingshengii]
MPYILIKQAENKHKIYSSVSKEDSSSYSGINEERVEEDAPLSEYLCDRKDAVTVVIDHVQHIMGEDTFYLDNHSLELITPPPERPLTLA